MVDASLGELKIGGCFYSVDIYTLLRLLGRSFPKVTTFLGRGLGWFVRINGMIDYSSEGLSLLNN